MSQTEKVSPLISSRTNDSYEPILFNESKSSSTSCLKLNKLKLRDAMKRGLIKCSRTQICITFVLIVMLQ